MKFTVLDFALCSFLCPFPDILITAISTLLRSAHSLVQLHHLLVEFKSPITLPDNIQT